MSEDEAKLKQSEQLWNMIHGEIYSAMKEDQPEPENLMLGDRTATKRTLRIFRQINALGYDVAIPDLEPVKPAVSLAPEEKGKGIVASIVGAPKVVFKTLGSTIKEGLGKLNPWKKDEEAKEEA